MLQKRDCVPSGPKKRVLEVNVTVSCCDEEKKRKERRRGEMTEEILGGDP